MTTLDTISIDLPAGMRRLDGDAEPFPGTDPGRATDAVTDERRWLSDDALYVAVTVSPASKGADLDPLALDLAVGGTVERYRVHFSGTVDSMTKLDIPGALAGRGARMHLESASGEALELMLVAALTPGREVVVLQATWPATLAPRYADRARALGRSLALPVPA
jgi:hypothetical protein